MPYRTDVVVLSNIPKNLGPDVEVIVGLPEKNPMSLPFGHKEIFAQRQDRYDLFIYTEDDMLITQRNIDVLLRANEVLPPNELVGFFQYEEYPDGRKYFPAAHGHFRWIPESLKTVGGYTFAQFTNEHSACYLLTQKQLRHAIASRGFLVPPHQGKYTMLESATTDPFTQCGFRKLLCLSHFEDLLVAHLPNCYLGRLGLDESDFYIQLNALSENNGNNPKRLLVPENNIFLRRWSKDCYEPIRNDLLACLPQEMRSVLSIGCGWGATEAALLKRGVRVVGIPIDPIIGACAKARGVEIVCGDLDNAVAQLSGHLFDGILISGILHLLPDPPKALRLATSLLGDNGILVASLPNVGRLPFLWRRVRFPSRYRGLHDYKRSGMHVIGRRRAARWFSQSGLTVRRVAETIPANWRQVIGLTFELAARLFSFEYIIVGQKGVGARQRQLQIESVAANGGNTEYATR